MTGPVVRLTIDSATTLEHVTEWADLALRGLGMPEGSTVQVSPTGALTVSAFLSQTELPGEDS